MVAALSVSGLLEGLGIMALLPLISVIISPDGVAAGSTITRYSMDLLNLVGLPLTIPGILTFIVGVMLIKSAIGFLAITQVAYASSRVTADLRREYMRSLMAARWLHLIGIRSGTIGNAMGNEAQRSALSFKQGCQTLAYILQIIVYGILVLFVSWKLTVAAAGAGIALVLILGSLTKTARKAGTELTTASDRLIAFITDSMFGAKPLKAMNKGKHVLHLFENDVGTLQRAQKKLDVTDQSIPLLSEPLMVIFVAAGLFFALSYSGLPVTELLFMAAVFLRMTMRIASAQRSYQSMAANESALLSLQKKINDATAAAEDFSGTRIPTLEKSINIEHVSFSYDSRNTLTDISLHIPARKFNVLFGSSGSGKTTLVDLITSIIEPAYGIIKIDGVPLSEIDKKAWKSMIGYVPQDVLLFHDTLLNNITLGDPDISRQAVEAALRAAGASQFVEVMEQRLDTVVGERGAKLSGGQRQRIAIARALVHEPQLLILDEATSALDPTTENEILRTVAGISREITVLAISHNPALLNVADHVFKIENGQVSEESLRSGKVVTI